MNNTDDKLKALQELNAKIREFNVLLKDLIQSLKDDKFKALQELNAKISEFNTLLVGLGESLKEDAVDGGLNQVTQ
jgi:hypothetical protein